MRQVNQDELVYAVASALRDVSPGLLRGLIEGNHEKRTRDRVIIAQRIVDKALARFEVLSATDLPPAMGELTYSLPLARMLGEEAPTLTYDVD